MKRLNQRVCLFGCQNDFVIDVFSNLLLDVDPNFFDLVFETSDNGVALLMTVFEDNQLVDVEEGVLEFVGEG